MSFLGNLFGRTKVDEPTLKYSPPGFNAGGLNTSFSNNSYNVTPSGARNDLIGSGVDNFNTFGNITGDLRATVAPGFNDLLNSRLNTLNDARTSAIGNLRENLASRRVLGSSFGQDTINRGEAEFARQKDAIVTDNFQKSLEMNNRLLGQQYDAYNKAFQTGLTELNLEASVAQELTGKASQALLDAAKTQASLTLQAQSFNAASALSQGQGLGQAIGMVATGGMSGLTGGMGGTGASPMGSFFSPSGSNPFNPNGSRNTMAYG